MKQTGTNYYTELSSQCLTSEESLKPEIFRKQIQRSCSQNNMKNVGFGLDQTAIQNKGITLIALVVTLVVLLILAGITINLAISEGGILGKANEAKEKQEVAEMLDKLTVAEASTATNYLAVDLEKYKAELKNQGIVKQDESNYIVSADGLSYELTSDNGYVFTVKEPTKGDIVIDYLGKDKQLPPRITNIKGISKTSNSVKIGVDVARLNSGKLTYQYKKQSEIAYTTFKENVTEIEMDYTGLLQNEIYNLKIIAENENGKSEKETAVSTGVIANGTISLKSFTWGNGKANIELQTTDTVNKMQYQKNSIKETWTDYTGAITNLELNDTIYARIFDGLSESEYFSSKVLDDKLPQIAIIELSKTNARPEEIITAKITQTDNESGIELEKCKWILNQNEIEIGTNEVDYTSGTFTTNPQEIDIKQTTIGKYYLHILTIDKAGNKKETISEKIAIRTTLVSDGSYSEAKGMNTPKLAEEMAPIKWDGADWVSPKSVEDWYNYNNKQWANAVTEDGSMWVWIPRYAYQISSNYHNGGVGISGTINVEFMKGLTDESNSGRTTFQNASGQGNWNIHPAFNYGSEVAGIWVAKFEASQTDSGINEYTYQNGMGGTSGIIKIQPSVNSWRNISIEDMYTKCLNYNTTLNSHQMKNVEWGAVAYLSKSKYGKENIEIGVNECTQYITGMGPGGSADVYNGSYAYDASYVYNTEQGQKTSTTGNVYGVYDMSGGSYELTAAYINNNYAINQRKKSIYRCRKE